MLGNTGLPRPEGTDTRHAPHQQTHSHFATVQPSKHPLDLSNRNKNFSLNDLAHSPAGTSKLKDSMREEQHWGKEAKKLRGKVETLERQNMTLHKLIIQYEQEVKDWQEKATRLNEELINYQNNELSNRPSAHHNRVPSTHNQQLKEYKNTAALLEESNKLHLRKISELSSQLQKTKRELSKANEIELLFHRIQADFKDAQRRLENEEAKNKQNQSYIEDLQRQLEFMSKEIPQKISYIQQEKTQITERERKQFEQEMNLLTNQLKQSNGRLQDEILQKQNLVRQNRELKVQIQRLSQAKSRSSIEMQQLYEEIVRLKEKQYQSNRKKDEQRQRSDKQQSIQKASLASSLINLRTQNERLTQTVSQKLAQTQKLQNTIRELKEHSLKASRIEEQRVINNTNINKHNENQIFRQEIKRLSQQKESAMKEMKEIQAFYLQQLAKLKEEYQNKQIRQGQFRNNQEQQRARLIRQNQSKEVEIRQLQSLIQDQQTHIEEIHSKYCSEIDKIMAENTSLRKSLEQLQSFHLKERQQSQIKIKEYKQYSYTANKLKLQNEHLCLQLKRQEELLSQQQQKELAYQQKSQLSQQRLVELTNKNSQYEYQIDQLHKETEKWKAYRLSQEDEARREARKYKKKVEELELQLIRLTQKDSVNDLQVLQKSIEALKEELLQQEIHSRHMLQEERMKLNSAMDQMEKEMQNILKECDLKITQRQQEITILHRELEEITAINIQLKKNQNHNASAFLELQELNEKLKKELLAARNDSVRNQNLLKKQESQYMAMKYASETQREIRSRYDKDMEDKVTQIQRLKLQVAQISDELQRKTMASKKHIETMDMTLKSREEELREAVQRRGYLESMIETYKAQNKRFKEMSDRERMEKQAIQLKIDQVFIQLNSETAKFTRIKEQKTLECQQYQSDAHQWREKWELSIKEVRKLEAKLAGFNTDLQTKERELDQLQKQLIKVKSQLQESKQNYQWLQERMSQSSREGNNIKKLKQEILELQQNDAANQATIETQKQKIQALIKDQSQKINEIDILLTKINSLEGDLKVASGILEQSDHQRAKRIDCYQSICNLPLTSSTSNRLTFDGDQELFLKVVCEYLRTFSSRLNEAIEEISKKQKAILRLTEEKENINSKYQKCKVAAMQFNSRREVQKQVVRNTFRFNEQILTHCQNIIKGDTNR